MRIVQTVFFALATVVALGLPSQAPAAFITSASGVTDPSVTIDFSQFTSTVDGPGPVQIGGLIDRDVTWESEYPALLYNGEYRFDANGLWDSGRTGYSGLNASYGTMTYRFLDRPVSQVGGFVNYAPGPLYAPYVLIEALAQDGTVLESHDVLSLAPISTPDATNEGAFRGITRATADIYAFRVSNSYVALDDLKFSNGAGPPSVATPLPGTVVLAAFGFVGIALRRARR